MEPNTQTTVLEQLLDPLIVDCFTPEVALHVAGYRADEATQARLDELSEKSTEGTLSPKERAEYEEFVQAIDLISIMQAKARRFLKDHAG